MKKHLALISLFGCFATPAWSESTAPADPYLWLEERESEKSLDWVKAKNADTLKVLENTSEYPELLSDAKEILYAKDKVPFSTFSEGKFQNFWQDKEHQHGILRETTLEEYKKDEPSWKTVLDLDELSKIEGENWVYKGDERLERWSGRRLLLLSRRGKDAVVVREFDSKTRQFVLDGFNVPESKTRVTPYDLNQVYIGSDFGPGSLTKSGYPRIVKLWTRGKPLAEAKTVFEGEVTDVSVSTAILEDREKKYLFYIRSTSFFERTYFYSNPDGVVTPVPIPVTSKLFGIRDGQLYLQLKDELKTQLRYFPNNSIVRLPLTAQSMDVAQIVYTPEDRVAIQNVALESASRIFISLLKNVRGQVIELRQGEGGKWVSRALPFPTTGTVSFALRDEMNPTDLSLGYYEDFLTPKTQYIVHTESESLWLEPLKKAPSRFHSEGFEVLQNFATSKDGTKIPYFMIQPKNLVADGLHPTVLYGYGGFESSKNPYYSGLDGKLWMERGGVYVVANIRGGGEFGPKWHNDAILHKRQNAFDDFAAVAEDLIARKITSPAHLGIMGGSNGGLLTGTVMTQRPELFNAVISAAPLLDMIRYTELPPGASWMGEYGNPKVKEDFDYLMTYSPYQNVKPGRVYPKAFFTTSTADDRVHPGHARKMAKKMDDMHAPCFFYENVNGGHSGHANDEELAHYRALEFSYLWMQLR